MTDKIRISDYDVFCGIDVDKRKYVVLFLDKQDRMKRTQMCSDPEVLIRYARKQYGGMRVLFVYEAGPTGFGLYDALVQAGERCLVAAPSMVPKAPGQRVKNNRLDAYGLAKNLRGGQIDGIKVPSMEYRDLRHLVQSRDTCVRETSRWKQRIKSLLLLEGIDFPAERWSKSTTEELLVIECRPVVRSKLDSLIASMERAKEQVQEASQQLSRYCKSNEELNRNLEYLTSISSIGCITASHFLARVGDWRQLDSVKKTCGFLGLGTCENSTGERVFRGEITAVGDRRLRAKIIQAAWVAIRKDKELGEFFVRICRRNPPQYGRKKAIIAVARKLVARMHAVLRDQRGYVKEKGVIIETANC